MGQVTLYVDTETEQRMKTAAKAAGLSTSKWVTQLIVEKTSNEWPEDIKNLAGAWPDFPTAEQLRSEEISDTPRESL
ncbi:MAG: CopG family transcriptional regulator [Candidatus Competibacteraceae bacterium]|jgi:hypothetical protein|nr:CopG family transcriptional regulator [Candidatus Competibacteraceae bacterium]